MKTSNDPRHLARKIAFAVFFSLTSSEYEIKDLTTAEIDKTIISAKESYSIDLYDNITLQIIVDSAIKNDLEIKKLIETNSKDWDVQKIYKTDYALIYIATAELLTDKTPKKVIIDEAIELAKEFGIDESPKFVNGVLAGIVSNLGKND